MLLSCIGMVYGIWFLRLLPLLLSIIASSLELEREAKKVLLLRNCDSAGRDVVHEGHQSVWYLYF
jgi:hypothetical protein